MKKTYINPAMVIVYIQTQQMLAASVTDGFSKSGVQTLEGDITSGNMGRYDDFDWEDEE